MRRFSRRQKRLKRGSFMPLAAPPPEEGGGMDPHQKKGGKEVGVQGKVLCGGMHLAKRPGKFGGLI